MASGPWRHLVETQLPNGRKASIALEELGLPYTVHPIDIGKDEQLKPEFLKISPNNRIPAIVDRENGISLMESGAILISISPTRPASCLPKSGEGHYRVLEWLMWQMGGPGPIERAAESDAPPVR